MIKGLDIFEKHFSEFHNSYIMIGGTACALAMDEAGIEFRATKDLDIVLTVEAIDAEFSAVFWEFIIAGQYSAYQKSKDKDVFYRFHSPKTDGYPFMLELFARNVNFELPKTAWITPVTWNKIEDTEAKSLSAILLDDEYYRFIHDGKIITNGISTISVEHLIPIKGYAWIDNKKRKQNGENIQDRHITKHRSDIIKLYQLLEPNTPVYLPNNIFNDVKLFLDQLEKENINPVDLGVQRSLEVVVSDLRNIYLSSPGQDPDEDDGIRHG